MCRILKVSEIFESLQGEGPYSGVPSIFVRLGGCNLNCGFGEGEEDAIFRCDTRHIWTKHKPMALYEVQSAILKYSHKHIVITGGEPLLQRIELNELIHTFLVNRYTIEIETNGTVDPAGIEDSVITYNVSPKINISSKARLVGRDVFGSSDVRLKIPYTTRDNVFDTLCVSRMCGYDDKEVILMPAGRNKDELDRVRAECWDFCVRYGFRYSDRIHIVVWGQKDGV